MSRSITLAGRVAAIALSLLTVGCAMPLPVQILPLADQSAVAELPEWQVGDRWVFRWKEGVAGGIYTREVVDATLSGYVVERGDKRRVWHYAPDLGYLMRLDDGDLARLHSPPRPYFKWPLAAGLKWDSGGGLT